MAHIKEEGSLSKALSILQQLFPKILPLQEYLESLQSDSPVPALLQGGDSQEYVHLLKTTLVGLSVNHRPLPPDVSFEQVSRQDEVILRTLQRLCRNSKGCLQNVLSLGYRLVNENSRSLSMKAPCVENVHPDTKVAKLERKVWKILLSRVGDDVMMHLFSSCSLFLSVPPGCYIQITGFPVYNLYNDWRKVPVPRRQVKARTANRKLRIACQLLKKSAFRRKKRQIKSKRQRHTTRHQTGEKRQQLEEHDSELQEKRFECEKETSGTSETHMQTSGIDKEIESLSSTSKRGIKRKCSKELVCQRKRQNTRQNDDTNDVKVVSEIICLSGSKSDSSVGKMAGSDLCPAIPSCPYHDDGVHSQKSFERHAVSDTETDSPANSMCVLDTGCATEDPQITSSYCMPTDTGETRLPGKKWKNCDKEDNTKVKRARQDQLTSVTEKGRHKEGKQKKSREKLKSGGGGRCTRKHGRQRRTRRKKTLKMEHSTKPRGKEEDRSKGAQTGGRSACSSEATGNDFDNPPTVNHPSYFVSTEKTISKTKVLYSYNPRERLPRKFILDVLPASSRGAQKLVQTVFLMDKRKHQQERQQPTRTANNRTASQTSQHGQVRKSKVNRTPRRYVKVQKLFVQLLKKHKQCRHYYLMKYHCPVNLNQSVDQQTGKTAEDAHLKLKGLTGCHKDMDAEEKNILDAPVFMRRPPNMTANREIAVKQKDVQQPIALDNRQQRTDDFVQSLPINLRGEKMSDDAASQEFLLSQHSSVQQIYELLRSILHKVVPEALWGSGHNKACFLTNTLLFLKMGRFEKITLHQLMTGMRLNDCDWLKLDSTSQLEFHARREALGKLVWWLFNTLVITVLKSYFYITETSTHRNQVLYYRKSVWNRLQDKATQQHLSRHMLRPVSKNTVRTLIRDQQCLGVAHLRFIPKRTGLRPIVNMGKWLALQPGSKQTGWNNASINYKLQNLFKVLTYTKDTVPDMLGASVFGTNDIYKKWKDFVVKHKASGHTGPLYFVKVDIQHCFDSIPQDKLLQVMAEVLNRHSEYFIRRYAKVIATKDNVKCTFEKHVAVLDDFVPDFSEFVAEQVETGQMYDAITVDQVCQQYQSSATLLSQLTQHVQNNVIQISGTYYHQITGISQGSRLSTLLCSFFYGDMERKYLQGTHIDGLLLRLVDDFLLVTPHLDQATTFLHTMLDGIPEYGCSVHPDKVMTNFPARYKDVVIVCQLSITWFPWCGMLFHTQSLGVRKDYTSYANLSIRYTLTLDLHQTAGQVMRQKLMNSVKAKCHAIFLDPQVNSAAVVTQTIYKLFLFTALQFHSYSSCLPHGHRVGDNPAFFFRMVIDISHYPHTLVTTMIAKEMMSAHLPLSQNAVEWLCLQAFKSKLSSHRSVYSSLLKPLGRHQKTIENGLDLQQLQQETSPENVAVFKSILA